MLLALDSVHLDFLPLVQSVGGSDLVMFAPGLACLSFSPLVLDSVHPGPFPLSHGPGCLGPLLLVPDRAHSELTLPLRGFVKAGPAMPVSDFVHLESLLLLKGMSHIGLCLFAVDSVHAGLFLFLRSHTRLGFSMLVSDLVHLELIPLPQGMAYLGLAPFAPDLLHLGSMLLVQSSGCPESFIPILCTAWVELSPSVPDFVCLEFPLFSKGFTCMELVSPASDLVQTDLLLLAQSFAHPGPTLLALDSAVLEFLLPVRSMS